MRCPICNEGYSEDGLSTLTVERNGSIILFKNVPALICNNCGESYFSNDTSKKIYKLSQEAFLKGVELEIIKIQQVA